MADPQEVYVDDDGNPVAPPIFVDDDGNPIDGLAPQAPSGRPAAYPGLFAKQDLEDSPNVAIAKDLARTGVATAKGILKSPIDALDGVYSTLRDPVGAGNALIESAFDPVGTVKAVGRAASDPETGGGMIGSILLPTPGVAGRIAQTTGRASAATGRGMEIAGKSRAVKNASRVGGFGAGLSLGMGGHVVPALAAGVAAEGLPGALRITGRAAKKLGEKIEDTGARYRGVRPSIRITAKSAKEVAEAEARRLKNLHDSNAVQAKSIREQEAQALKDEIAAAKLADKAVKDAEKALKDKENRTRISDAMVGREKQAPVITETIKEGDLTMRTPFKSAEDALNAEDAALLKQFGGNQDALNRFKSQQGGGTGSAPVRTINYPQGSGPANRAGLRLAGTPPASRAATAEQLAPDAPPVKQRPTIPETEMSDVRVDDLLTTGGTTGNRFGGSGTTKTAEYSGMNQNGEPFYRIEGRSDVSGADATRLGYELGGIPAGASPEASHAAAQAAQVRQAERVASQAQQAPPVTSQTDTPLRSAGELDQPGSREFMDREFGENNPIAQQILGRDRVGGPAPATPPAPIQSTLEEEAIRRALGNIPDTYKGRVTLNTKGQAARDAMTPAMNRTDAARVAEEFGLDTNLIRDLRGGEVGLAAPDLMAALDKKMKGMTVPEMITYRDKTTNATVVKYINSQIEQRSR